MPTPKSVVKFSTVKENGQRQVKVKYVSEVDKTQYYIYELTRAALRDSCKYVKKAFQTSYNARFKRRTGDGSNAPQYKVFSGAKTTKPAGYIGLPKGSVKGFYAFFQEVETAGKTPLYRLLFKAAADNIAEIRKIQAQYLEHINEPEADVEKLIDETEQGSTGVDEN